MHSKVVAMYGVVQYGVAKYGLVKYDVLIGRAIKAW